MDVKHSVTAAGRKDCFDPVVLILHSASVTQTAGEESEEFALLDNKKKRKKECNWDYTLCFSSFHKSI